ncbi:hypothetical protein EYZ11_011012 [Aspergillus tanneri]|uniref:Quinate repressor protein n=1 Tax=Aspergillus tanneri TaxID=1220188 RepID=A0A4S3J483_9EURO|nr:hypothetical protein EYZ11_011012 [Aspergillus tanneri]
MSEDANFGVTSKAYVPYRGTSSFSFLALKSTEQNFLRFIRGIHDTNENIICRAGIHTLAATPLESRPYTLDAYELKFVLKDPCPSEESGILSNSIRDSISKTFASMRRQSCVPLIFHAELDPECAPNPLYLELLHYGLRFCPDYLSVDLRCNKEVFQSIRNACGSTKILGHYMDPEPFQDSWNSKSRFAKYLAAWDMGCHMVRLVQHAISIDDNLGVQQFHRKINALSGPHPPLIAYNTGLLGRTSTILNSLLTPVVQPASYDKGIAASTMITATEAQRALYAMFILHPMLFCVIGAKVSHSLAPAMHSAACRAWGIPHEWTPKEGSSLDALDELVNSPVFGGAMISLPYKSEVLSYLHSISPAAAAIGAVNTIVPLRFELDPNIPCHLDPRFRKHQSGHIKALYGDNTDWIGFRNCICHSLSPANAIRHGTTGLVIGAGGMARAAVYAMLQVGIKNIAIYNRTLEKAEQVAEHFNNADFCRPDSAVEHTMASVLGGVREAAMGVVVLKSRSDPWPDVMRLPTVIVSTLPGYGAGRDAAPDFLLPDQWLKSSTGGAFIEFAYEPVKSPLFRQMQAKSEAGWVIVDGLDVLPEQGFAQFELFTGRIAPKRLMRMEVLRSYKQGATDDEQAYIEARLRHLQHVADWDA